MNPAIDAQTESRMFPHGYPPAHHQDVDGRWRCIPLQRGLQVQTIDIHLPQDLPVLFNRNEPHMEFGCLFSGKLHGSVKIDNGRKQYFVNNPGQSWCSLAGKVQGCAEYLSESPFYSVSFFVHGALLRDILSVKGVFPGHLFHNKTPQEFKALGALTPAVKQTAGQIAEAINHPVPAQHLFLISKAYELLSQIFMSRENGPLVGDSGEMRSALACARKILDDHLASPPSLEALARKCGLCVTYLTEGFKKTFGTTVFGYVRRQRLSRARELMAVHGLNASDAAWEVGYSSLSAFHRAFLAEYGTTPGSYRRRFKNTA